LAERNTEEAYWDYVKKLAQAAGIDPEDDQAVRQFDRKRPGKKLSNEQFKNRHDPDAKISRHKGKTDLIYKPEHSVDMETGAIVQAQLIAADQSDSVGLAQRIHSVQESLEGLKPEKRLTAAVADRNYHSLANVCALQQAGLKVVIADGNAHKAARRATAGTSVEHCKRLDKVCAAKPVAASCDCGVNRLSAVLPISWTAAVCGRQRCAAKSTYRSVTSLRRLVTISANFCAKSSVVELLRWLWLPPRLACSSLSHPESFTSAITAPTIFQLLFTSPLAYRPHSGPRTAITPVFQRSARVL